MLQHTLTAPSVPARVVVLGGSGFIGAHLIAGLGRAGAEGVSISSAQIDLTDAGAPASLAAEVQPEDALVLISCLTRDKGDDPATLMKNLVMAEHVGRFLEERGCAHVVYLSSDAVFRDDLSLVNEDSEQGPGGMYGLAHVVRERMMQHSCGKANIPLATLRPCAVYGAGDTHHGYGPNRFLRTALAEGKISLFGSGEEQRDHVFVEDLCRLITACLSLRSTGTLNVATGRSHSFAEVAAFVAAAVPGPVEIVPSARRTSITHRHCDIAAVHRAFPTFAFTALEEGLRRTATAVAATAR